MKSVALVRIVISFIWRGLFCSIPLHLIIKELYFIFDPYTKSLIVFSASEMNNNKQKYGEFK